MASPYRVPWADLLKKVFAIDVQLARVGKAPGLHTSRFAPQVTPTLRTGMAALTAAAFELLGKP